jgi:hypothetical protein
LKLAVDPQVDLEDEVHVYQDYSIDLILHDVEFKTGSISDKVIKLQLLERHDNKKWFFWMANGTEGGSLKTQVFPSFNKFDALANFEKKFDHHTGNRWDQREMFVPRQDKYQIKSEQREKERLALALNTEKEVKDLL